MSGFYDIFGTGGKITILDDGVLLTVGATSIDFTGAGVTATNIGGAVTVNIPGAAADTLLSVSAASTTAPNSIYQMSAGIPVHFKSSDANTLLYLDETNEMVGIGTATPTYPLHLGFDNASVYIGTSQKGYLAIGAQGDYRGTWADRPALVINTVALQGDGSGGLTVLNYNNTAGASLKVTNLRADYFKTYSNGTEILNSLEVLSNTKAHIGFNATATSAQSAIFSSTGTTTPTVVIKGIASQSADLLQFQNSSGTNVGSVSNGTFAPGAVATAYSGLSLSNTYGSTAAASGAFKPINLTYTINNTGATNTGTATGIFLNATETALNGMTHNLMDLQVGGSSKFKVSNAGIATLASFSAVAGRATSYQAIGGIGTSTIMSAPADGVLKLTNEAETDFNRLQFGGTTSSFPALKRNATGLDVRLADDSGYAPLAASIGTFTNTINTANAITATGNAATIPITSKNNIVTNNSAATLTITLTTSGAVNMQEVTVQILDFSAVAQTITWVNTEDSTVTAPVTSNGSTTLPLTVKFIYNSATSKWRTILKA